METQKLVKLPTHIYADYAMAKHSPAANITKESLPVCLPACLPAHN